MSYIEIRVPESQFIQLPLVVVSNPKIRLVDFHPPSSGPEVALYYGPWSQREVVEVKTELLAHLRRCGFTPLADRLHVGVPNMVFLRGER